MQVDDVTKGAWVEVQKKAFTRWANSHLKQKGCPEIGDLFADTSDGAYNNNICGGRVALSPIRGPMCFCAHAHALFCTHKMYTRHPAPAAAGGHRGRLHLQPLQAVREQ